jgi:DNA-binding MarR family transcriptional regulator
MIQKVALCNDLVVPDEAEDSFSPLGKADEQLVDAFIAASQALVAAAVRTLAELGEDITLAQYRALMVLTHGPQRAADLSEALGVTAGTGSRMIERLLRKRLVLRSRSREDRRATYVHLTNAGRRLVERANEHQRQGIARILGQLPDDSRAALSSAMGAFAQASALEDR